MAEVLPDLLRPGLRIVFCGTAAGSASEFERLPEFGIGLTDICKVLHGSDQEVGTAEFDVPGLEARIADAEPDNLAFNGKNAAQAALGRNVDYGQQPERIGGAAVWVLLQPLEPLAATGMSSRGESWRSQDINGVGGAWPLRIDDLAFSGLNTR